MFSRPPEPICYAPPMEPYLEVLHCDDDILVLAKPSGLLSVPGKAPEHSDCLEQRAREAYPNATTVHRLDKDTSGVMVMALNRKAHRHLGLQFEKVQEYSSATSSSGYYVYSISSSLHKPLMQIPLTT